ncbi:hypothetical protein SEPCBS57363_004825 [Sporothrix epigloea]|uniref:RRM domain-containing protein n=1 Tax=Sporothrix epigloea TaxID=1892477 RepID=A0ABP0DUC2_9PEZI
MFIGGLNWETTDQSLRDYFSQYGEVLECTVMRDGISGRSRGFGFLTFKDPKTVNVVMVKEHYLDGKIIDPKRAIPRDEQEKTSKIFVGGVSQDTTDQDFREYFAQFGRVVDATLMMDKDTGRPRGFGFVTFESEAGVDACLSADLQIHGKPIEVKKAQPRGNLREDDDSNRRGGPVNKFRKGPMGSGGGGGYDDQGGNQQMSGNNGNMAGGMTPQVMAQYWQRMQQYFAVMQQQVNMNRGMAGAGGMPNMPNMPNMGGMGGMGNMGGGMGNMGNMGIMGNMNGMNPQMMQMMQMQQMQQQMMNRNSYGPGGPSGPNGAAMMGNHFQGGGGSGGGNGPPNNGPGGRGNFNAMEQHMFEQQKYDQAQRSGSAGPVGGGPGSAAGGGSNNGSQSPWGASNGGGDGSYDNSSNGQGSQQHGMGHQVGGGGRGGFHNNNRGGGSIGLSDTQNAPPANAPTGPKNAGRPGANYRGGGRGAAANRGFHPYSRG